MFRIWRLLILDPYMSFLVVWVYCVGQWNSPPLQKSSHMSQYPQTVCCVRLSRPGASHAVHYSQPGGAEDQTDYQQGHAVPLLSPAGVGCKHLCCAPARSGYCDEPHPTLCAFLVFISLSSSCQKKIADAGNGYVRPWLGWGTFFLLNRSPYLKCIILKMVVCC